MGRARKKQQTTLGKRVSIAAGAGMPHEEIATALDMTRKDLERDFAWELSVGAHLERLELVEALHASALAGNVAAVKAYTALSIKSAGVPLPEVSAEKVGKKEQRNVDAKTAQNGTGWEGLLRPMN